MILKVIPVRFNFITEKYSKSGKDNPNWQVLHDIETQDATWQEKGIDGAYKVRLNCQVGSNPFIDRNTGNIVDRPSIDVNFAHPATMGFNDNQRNTFKFDMAIINYHEQEVEDGDNYGVVLGFVFNSVREEAIPVTLAVRSQGGMNYFENLVFQNFLKFRFVSTAFTV